MTILINFLIMMQNIYQQLFLFTDPIRFTVYLNTSIMNNGNTIKTIKTIIIGKISVGKSSLMLRYAEGTVVPQSSTIGIDSKIKKIIHQGETYSIQLWDTAGHERYRTIVYNYFKLTQAAVVVFDISDLQSLNDAAVWLQQIVLHCGSEIPIVLVANKCDLYSEKGLKEQLQKINYKIQVLKRQYNCQFFAVSAYNGKQINDAFDYLISKAINSSKTKIVRDTIKLNSSIEIEKLIGKKKRFCCQ